MFGIFLNFRYGINSSTISIVNTCSAAIAAFVYILFSYEITKLIKIYSNDIENPEFKSRYSLITDELKIE